MTAAHKAAQADRREVVSFLLDSGTASAAIRA
ncbi:MAG: hypothetical protein ACK56I_07620, partial [bacterium]